MAHRDGSKVIVKAKASLEAIARWKYGAAHRLRVYASDHPRGFDGLGPEMLELIGLGLHLPTIEDVQTALAPLGLVCPSCKSRQAPGAFVYGQNRLYCLDCVEEKLDLCTSIKVDAERYEAALLESRLYVEEMHSYCHPGLWPIWLHSKARQQRHVRYRLSNHIAKVIRRLCRGSCAGRWWRRRDRLTGDIYAEHMPCPHMDEVGKELLIKGSQSFTFSRAGGQCLRCATFSHNDIARRNLGPMLCHETEQLRARVLCEGILFAASLVTATERIVAPYFDSRGDVEEVILSTGKPIHAQERAYRLRWQDHTQWAEKVYGSTSEVEDMLAIFWL